MRRWLFDLRKKANLTQKQVAESIGVTRECYTQIELDKRGPGVETAKKIGTLFKFDWTRFYEGNEK